MRILYIEDSDTNIEMMERALKVLKHELVAARTGTEGLKTLEADNNFDLVFVDLQLPDIGGLSVIQQIHASNPMLPMVAITAYAMPDDKRQCLASGCVGYITKPYKFETIRDLLKATQH